MTDEVQQRAAEAAAMLAAASDARDARRLWTRVRHLENAVGATYRLCGLLQPSSFIELREDARQQGLQLTSERLSALFEGYHQWVDAGKPGAIRLGATAAD